MSPLRIKLDGDTSAIPVTPDSLTDPATLVVDDRVRTELSGNRLVVIGRVGGAVRVRAAQGVIPSSVAVGSGSASVDADGLITFTGVSSVSLNDVFDGVGGDVYELYLRAVSSTGAIQHLRMRASGTDYSGGGYDRIAIFSNGGSPVTSAYSVDTRFCFLSPAGTGPGGPISCRTLFTEPGKSGKTVSVHQATANVGNSVYIWSEAAAVSAGAYDGITLITSAGTLTGTVKVVKIA